MNIKLTLRMDETLIEVAKKEANHRGKSLSRMVSDYFAALAKSKRKFLEGKQKPLPPLTAALAGCLKGANVDERAYRRHLEKKYA